MARRQCCQAYGPWPRRATPWWSRCYPVMEGRHCEVIGRLPKVHRHLMVSCPGVTRERTQEPLHTHRAKHPYGRGPKDLNSGRGPKYLNFGRGPKYLKFLFFLASLIDWHVRASNASHMLHCSAVLAVKLSSFLFF